MTDVYVALATAAIVALLTVADITEPWRRWLWNNSDWGKILDCGFCSAWWVAGALASVTHHGNPLWLAVRIPAIVAGSMFALLLINMAISTYNIENDEE